MTDVLVRRGGKPIAAKLKLLQDFFAKPENERFVTDDLDKLLAGIDEDQQRRYSIWAKERVQYPVQYIPPTDSAEVLSAADIATKRRVESITSRELNDK